MDQDDRERLLELFASMQGDMVPSVVRVFERDDLRLIHSAILLEVDRGDEPPTVNQLAERIGRSVSRTSRLVDQLAGRGLIQRDEDGSDRRVRRLRPTDEGRTLLHRVRRMRLDALAAIVDHLTDDERAQVIDAMELLARAARRYGDAHRSAED